MNELVVAERQHLVNIANAIRTKTGSDEEMYIYQMPDCIREIGNSLPDSEVETFGNGIENTNEYAITGARLNEIAAEAQRLANTTDALTPSQIVEGLQKVIDDDKLLDGSLTKLNNDTVDSIKAYCFYTDSNITGIDCPKVKTVNGYAFNNCSNLASVDLQAVETVENYSFTNCDKLSYLNMPLVKTIGNYAFEECGALPKDLSFANLESIGTYAFSHCGKLETFYAPKLQTIGSGAFYYSTKLKDIYCPEVTTLKSGLSQITFGETSITSITMPKITAVPESCFYAARLLEVVDMESVTSVGMQSFSTCNRIRIINMPLCTSIGRDAFSLSAIEDINGGSVNLPMLKSVGVFAFKGCPNLKTVYLPEATSISQGAFQDCTSLTRCEFEKQFSIGYQIVAGCTKLTAFILRSETMCPLSETNAFGNTPIASGTGYVYVPKSLLETYKTNSKWATYANQIRAIEDWPDVADGKEVVRDYTVDVSQSENYTFNNKYVDLTDGYSLKTTYVYEPVEDEIDAGVMLVLPVEIDDKASIEELVVTVS